MTLETKNPAQISKRIALWAKKNEIQKEYALKISVLLQNTDKNHCFNPVFPAVLLLVKQPQAPQEEKFSGLQCLKRQQIHLWGEKKFKKNKSKLALRKKIFQLICTVKIKN